MSTKDPIRAVFVSEPGDPALDRAAPSYGPAVVEYARRRTPGALAALPLRPGHTPHVWLLRPLKGRAMAALVSTRDEGSRQRHAFLLGVVGVELPDGTVVRPETFKSEQFGDMATDAWEDSAVDRCGGAWSVVRELGDLVLRITEVGPPSDADPTGRYALPAGARLDT